MNEPVGDSLHLLMKRSKRQLLPSVSIERVLEKSHTFPPAVVEQFPENFIVGNAHLASFISIDNMLHLDSTGVD